MDRLTMYTPCGYESINPVDLCLDEYSDINFERILDKLGEYEDAEEQGLLERLKVNVGDFVWVITKPANYTLGPWKETVLSKPEALKVKSITLTKDSVQYHVKGCMYCENEFGSVVFLTKEEAEQALKQLN